MICNKCSHKIPDDSTYCPQCGNLVYAQNKDDNMENSNYESACAPVEENTTQNEYTNPQQENDETAQQDYNQNQQQQGYNPNYQQYNTDYQQNYQYQQNNPYGYQQQPYGQYDPNNQIVRKGKNAKTLGIIGIVIGIIIPLVGWICGGIGMTGANNAYFATGDMEFLKNKKLCTAAIIVATIRFALGIFKGLFFSVVNF